MRMGTTKKSKYNIEILRKKFWFSKKKNSWFGGLAKSIAEPGTLKAYFI